MLELYRRELRTGGVAAADVDDLQEHFLLILRRLLAGFIMGYGGRDPDTMQPRELQMIRLALSPDGLCGCVRSMSQ